MHNRVARESGTVWVSVMITAAPAPRDAPRGAAPPHQARFEPSANSASTASRDAADARARGETPPPTRRRHPAPGGGGRRRAERGAGAGGGGRLHRRELHQQVVARRLRVHEQRLRAEDERAAACTARAPLALSSICTRAPGASAGTSTTFPAAMCTTRRPSGSCSIRSTALGGAGRGGGEVAHTRMPPLRAAGASDGPTVGEKWAAGPTSEEVDADDDSPPPARSLSPARRGGRAG